MMLQGFVLRTRGCGSCWAKTTGHQLLTLRCGCGCETKAHVPDGVTAPVQYGPRLMGAGIYLWHGQFLSRDRACRALSELFGSIDALLALGKAAEAARQDGKDAIPATASAHLKHSPVPSRADRGSPKPDRPARHQSVGPPEPESRPAYPVTKLRSTRL
jgi:hypothetical protein